MKYLYLIIVGILFPSIAFAKKPQDLGETLITTVGMVVLVGVIVAIIRFFKK